MKYGDTLRQRSIPEWGHFNIDYDHLKDLIKHQTTPGTNKAVSIPGQGETTERAFGETFFAVLKAQHDRINLFVRSKSGEIERRLRHISKSLAQLQQRRPEHTSGLRLPARIVERYAKIDADVTKAGEEIRSLARFRAAQQTGFSKILKKYKRWTGDSEPQRFFKAEVSSSPESFFQLDLGYLLDQYIDVLGALRSPFDPRETGSVPGENVKTLSSASHISKAVEEGTEVDFDLALSLTPLGSRGSKATYWIHPDHIVEVQVVLLQHMRLYTGVGPKQSPTPDSPSATPQRRKSSSSTDKYIGNEDIVGQLVLDHPESFAIKQNASTISSNEDLPGALGVKASGNARWAVSGEAAVVVGLGSDVTPVDMDRIKSAKLKRKHLVAMANVDSPLSDKRNQEGPNTKANQESDDDEKNLQAVRGWFIKQKDTRPIAGICSKRTRYLGLHNSSTAGLWATLDRDVFMKASLWKDLKGTDWVSDARNGSTQFPYAVLEVRTEGLYSAGLIKTLDRSHLVERVRGFTLESHAVWTCCQPKAMTCPFWVSMLEKDIRKLPAPIKRRSRKADSSTGSVSNTSPPPTSTPATSATDGQISPFTCINSETPTTSAPESIDPPSLQAFRKKPRRQYLDYRPHNNTTSLGGQQRYWNEYDNPESEDDGYYIYTDPNETVKFPGQEFFEGCVSRTRRLFGIRESAEESPSLSAADYASSDDETVDETPVLASRSYGTIPSHQRDPSHEGYFSGLFRSFRNPHREAAARRQTAMERRSLLGELEVRQHKREMTKLRFYSTCLATAVVIDALLAIMTMTSRKKERGVVDAVVLFGAICNLLLCIVAIASMSTRREILGWMHQGTVIGVVGAVVVVDMLLLQWTLRV